MRNISFLIVVFSIIQGCKAQRNLIDKSYDYSYAKEHTVLDNSIHFETDSTLSIGGGRGQYEYWSYWKYRIINDNEYFIYQDNHKRVKPTKEELKDTLLVKIHMADVFNDTIYWKNDKEFIFRERLFKLFEYKGIPLEDQ